MMFNPVSISLAKVASIKIRDTRFPDYKVMEIHFEDESMMVIDIHSSKGLIAEIEQTIKVENLTD